MMIMGFCLGLLTAMIFVAAVVISHEIGYHQGKKDQETIRTIFG